MAAPGSGSVAKPTKGRKRPPEGEDAFIRAINRAWAWAANNTATVVVSAVFLALIVGGFFWYRTYQQNREVQATNELQTLQARVAGGDTAVIESLETFLTRFDGTRPAEKARIMLARQQLLRDRGEEAVGSVQPVVDDSRAEAPIGHAARRLLAEAQAAAGDTAAALATLERLSENARFAFQRRQASAERASLLIERGRLEEALAVYERLVEEAEDGSDEASRYRLRLGETKARLTASGGGDAATEEGEERG